MGKGSVILGGGVLVVGSVLTLQTQKDKDKNMIVISPNIPISFNDLSDIPTTLSGYGITDAMTTPLSNILYWDSDEYKPYIDKASVSTNAYLYLGTDNPDGTGRLNLNGKLYTTSLYTKQLYVYTDSGIAGITFVGTESTSFTIKSGILDYGVYILSDSATASTEISIGQQDGQWTIRFYTDPDDVSFVILDDTANDVMFSVDGADEEIILGCDVINLRGQYTYYRQTLGINTIGDWRMYCNGVGFYIDYLSSITPVTWTNKHTILI